MTRRHSPDTLQVYLGCKNGSARLKGARGDVKAEKAILTKLFQGAGWRAEEITRAMTDADDFYVEY